METQTHENKQPIVKDERKDIDLHNWYLTEMNKNWDRIIKNRVEKGLEVNSNEKKTH